MATQARLRELFDYSTEGTLVRKRCIHCGARNVVKTTPHSEGYLYIAADRCQLLHRMIWIWHFDVIPPGKEIDHIDGDRGNNRIENLRLVTRQQNVRNRRLPPKHPFGHFGIFKTPQGRYRASIGVKEQNVYLGTYGTLDEAITARTNAERKYRFHPNHGILPKGTTGGINAID